MEISASQSHSTSLLICAPAPVALLDDPLNGRCGHRILDGLLSEAIEGDSSLMDELLDLKFALLQKDDAEAALEIFSRLRPHLEKQYYLASYRLRRWLETQIAASISPGRGYAAREYSLNLRSRTMREIRKALRQTAEKDGLLTFGSLPQVRFTFRTTTEEVRSATESPLRLLHSKPI